MNTPFRRLLATAALLLLLPASQAMELGTNFWNLRWHKPNDCFQDVKNVSGENPWNPQFLKETSIYSCYRFMDWDVVNNSKRTRWSERTLKSSPDQTTAAYEWMIDLCNRQNADLWVCMPHLTVNRNSGDAPSDYALRLCLLVKTGVDMREIDLTPLLDRLSTLTAADLVKAGGVQVCEPLKPNLKLYIEYSNETWNASFAQTRYCLEEGTALNLDPGTAPGKDGKIWSNCYKFHAWAALRIFRAADLVYGVGSPRVVRTLAQQVTSSWQTQRQIEVLNNPAFNPWGTKADAMSIAPYFGHNVPGNDPDAVQKLRAEIEKRAKSAAAVGAVAKAANLRLIAYEGGQHVTKGNPAKINRDPIMHDLYTEYLAEMAKHLSLFCHYAHVGQAGDRGAWGAIEHTGQRLSEAPKYRALVEWRQTHPRK